MSSETPSAVRPPRWKIYLTLGRVSNLPTVWTNCVAASLLATGRLDPIGIVVATLALSVFYVAGMFLNDAFDRKYDAIHRPERPIPGGDITATEVFAMGFGLIVVAELSLAIPSLVSEQALDIEALVWGLALIVLIVYYNYGHKADPLSPVVMALCRVMVYFTAASLAGTAMTRPVMFGAGILAAYLIGLTYVAKQENLSRIQSSWPIVFIAIPFLYHLGHLDLDVGSLLWVGFLGWVVFSLSFLYRTDGHSIPRAVIGLIAGISLMDGLAIASIGAGLPFVTLGILGFILTLSFQRFIPGT